MISSINRIILLSYNKCHDNTQTEKALSLYKLAVYVWSSEKTYLVHTGQNLCWSHRMTDENTVTKTNYIVSNITLGFCMFQPSDTMLFLLDD